jgi:plasmid stabilization system protein ParE
MKAVSLSRAAVHDSEAIQAATLTKFGARQAARMRRELAAAMEGLLRMPRRGCVRPELMVRNRIVRTQLVGAILLLVYEVSDEEVFVVRVLHAARDIQAVLGEGLPGFEADETV